MKSGPYADQMLINGRAPKSGEVMRLPNLANTFRKLATEVSIITYYILHITLHYNTIQYIECISLIPEF